MSHMQMSRTCPAHVPHMSHKCPTHVPQMSFTCPTNVTHMATESPCYYPPLGGQIGTGYQTSGAISEATRPHTKSSKHRSLEGQAGNWCVSRPACVRTPHGAYVMSDLGEKSLCGDFPVSFFFWTGGSSLFPCPPRSYPASAGFIGMSIRRAIIADGWIWAQTKSPCGRFTLEITELRPKA